MYIHIYINKLRFCYREQLRLLSTVVFFCANIKYISICRLSSKCIRAQVEHYTDIQHDIDAYDENAVKNTNA